MCGHKGHCVAIMDETSYSQMCGCIIIAMIIILQLLQEAFQARMTFTIGTSVTTGDQNAVVWDDIHHKTIMHGGP